VVQQEEESAEETEASEESEEEDETLTAEAGEPEGFGDRLVSVDNVEKYITIGNYKGLTLDNTVDEISDDEIESQIQQDLKNTAAEVTDKDATIQNGDIATINYVGMKDGEAFDGGTANNYDLTVGAGLMIDGFEEGLIGMKKGETKDLNLTFPEDYMASELAGEDVVFQVTVQNFRRVPELTEDWVTENTNYTTIEEYRESVKASLQEYAEYVAKETLRNSAWSTVLSSSEVMEYPQADIDNAAAEFKQLYERYAAQGDMTLEDFVESQGISMDDFEEQSQQYAQAKVKQSLIIQGIMDAEGLSLDDEESLAIQDELVAEYSAGSLADLIDRYGQVAVDESIGLLRVTNFILENAIVSGDDSEEAAANEDIVNEDAAEEDTADESTAEETSENIEE
jgi:trigger factor